jgi:hypothetical protein
VIGAVIRSLGAGAAPDLPPRAGASHLDRAQRASALAARVVVSRDTVGSETAVPKIAGAPRSTG